MKVRLNRYGAIDDKMGRDVFATSFGDLVVASRVDDVAVQFQYNIATADVTTTLDGGANGSVSQSLSRAVLASSTNAAGTAVMESKNWIRYRPGHDGFALFTGAWLTPPTHANGKALVGPYSADDGMAVGYVGTSFGVLRRRGTQATSSSFQWRLALAASPWTCRPAGGSFSRCCSAKPSKRAAAPGRGGGPGAQCTCYAAAGLGCAG